MKYLSYSSSGVHRLFRVTKDDDGEGVHVVILGPRDGTETSKEYYHRWDEFPLGVNPYGEICLAWDEKPTEEQIKERAYSEYDVWEAKRDAWLAENGKYPYKWILIDLSGAPMLYQITAADPDRLALFRLFDNGKTIQWVLDLSKFPIRGADLPVVVPFVERPTDDEIWETLCTEWERMGYADSAILVREHRKKSKSPLPID